MSSEHAALELIGARENNLRELSLSIPHDQLVVVTGPSGSGKSSLAFDTLYAEGQRRYIETFSPYVRQFLDKLKKPDLISSSNVRPALAIQQRTRITSSRSTVGSLTNINDLLKILWSNLAIPYSPLTGEPLKRWSVDEIVAALPDLLKNDSDTVLVCSPLVLPEKRKNALAEIKRLIILGYVRYYSRSERVLERLSEKELPVEPGELLYVVLDRVRADSVGSSSFEDSVGQALRLARGRCVLVRIPNKGAPSEHIYRTYFSLSDSIGSNGEDTIPEPKPALFSFNTSLGACTECRGFGKVLQPDPLKIVPDPNLSLEQGAITCWNGPSTRGLRRRLLKFCEDEGISTDSPWDELGEHDRERIMHHRSRSFRGVVPWLSSLERKAYKMHVRVQLARYRSQYDCPKCNDARLQPGALVYRLCGMTLPELWNTPISAVIAWAAQVREDFTTERGFSPEVEAVMTALDHRLDYLSALGLPYLTLGRAARTLSGGETQRVNLATALGSELVSTMFVLDEPSVGLHPRDTERLIGTIRSLQERGNSVVVVEHDLDCIEAADHIIELGPGGGELGGEALHCGSAKTWSGIKKRELSEDHCEPGKHSLKIRRATARNLKSISCDLPLGNFTTLCGVSGSGKSTLVSEVILKAWEAHSINRAKTTGPNRVTGFKHLNQVLLVNQGDLAKSPRANIATYSGIWARLRALLAGTERAKVRSLTASSFSFNVDGGRCPACKGAGYLKEDMQFLSDVYVRCEVCLGRRFQDAVLGVEISDRNVHDWLETSIAKCAELLFEDNKIVEIANVLVELGLGHLRLGHSLSELSGGEAQRLKLVPYIQGAEKGTSLLIFDEPTTGLHINDTIQLIRVFRRLRDAGHTVLCIEHNLEVIKHSDWLIELGPEGGAEGGELVLTGTPTDFLKKENLKRSPTARYLFDYVEDRKDRKRTPSIQSVSRPQPRLFGEPEPLTLSGAREHNLKGISLSLPHNKFVAITGVSGSGKSTIAKDIIYAEGQRRYLDCLSPYARQFIRELRKPDLDEITNIRPTVCVYQHTFLPGTLSTVGTMSEVYNYLRLLYSKVGQQFCPDHPDQSVQSQTGAAIAEAIKDLGRSEIRLLAPIIKKRKGTHKAVFQRAQRSDISEVRVDGVFGTPGQFQDGLERSRVHSIDFVWGKFAPERVPTVLITDAVEEIFALSGGTVVVVSESEELVFSRERGCPVCGRGFFRPDPEDLSFHARRGRCTACDGTGVDSKGGECSTCGGSRLSELGRFVRIEGQGIADVSRLAAPELESWLKNLTVPEHHAQVAAPVIQEALKRLESLIMLGLDYIPLNRSCSALSTGELQRLRLAAAMGTPLSGAMYIFDEPSAGLHPNDNQRVLEHLREVQKAGNTVALIEHDRESILAADHVVEVGPGGGRNGGEIVFEGSVSEFERRPELVPVTKVRTAANSDPSGSLRISEGACNTVNNLTLDLPLGQLVTVIGVSGAGKSSLVNGIVLGTLLDNPGRGKSSWSGPRGKLEATTPIDRVIVVDQSPIGKNSRSTPASYLKVWDDIRKLYASTIEARAQGWGPGFFSYNSGDGRCPECKGQGQQKLEMTFLAEAEVTCEYCQGSRYTVEARSAKYLGASVDEVLQLTFAEAKQLFANHARIHRVLHHACELGLDYLTLGQSSVTLSGGESQRIKLVSELSGSQRGHTLYVLDEPTRGLHRADVAKLLSVLRVLIGKGNSILTIEHDYDVVSDSDYLIEMGPGPGDAGGSVIFSGTPGELTRANTPWGQILEGGKSTGQRRVSSSR